MGRPSPDQDFARAIQKPRLQLRNDDDGASQAATWKEKFKVDWIRLVHPNTGRNESESESRKPLSAHARVKRQRFFSPRR